MKCVLYFMLLLSSTTKSIYPIFILITEYNKAIGKNVENFLLFLAFRCVLQ